MKKTFLDYIQANTDRDDPIGDYCSDTLRAIKIKNPSHLKYKKDFESLLGIFACDEARKAFLDAWAEFRHG